MRVQGLTSAAAIKPWSRIVCTQHWDMFSYVAHLPEHRWVRRVLVWNPTIKSQQLGRPRQMWDHNVAAFCRYKELGHWLEYTHRTRKRGWHTRTLPTTSAWPKVKQKKYICLVYRLRLKRGRHILLLKLRNKGCEKIRFSLGS